jgi:hypothetical protein
MRVRLERVSAPPMVRFPEMRALPCTAKSEPGVVVPTPTLPFASMMKAVPEAFKKF